MRHPEQTFANIIAAIGVIALIVGICLMLGGIVAGQAFAFFGIGLLIMWLGKYA